MMSEDIYAKPDRTKKVRFQKNEVGNKEENDQNRNDDIDNEMIYDNQWAEGNSPPKVEDNTTEDPQQINSAGVDSEKRHQVKAVILPLGLLCFLLLVTLIVLVIISIISWSSERNLRIELQKSNGDLEWFNQNLTERSRLLEDEKTNLTIERDQLEAINTNLTSEKYQLKAINSNLTNERHQLETVNSILTKERHELCKELRAIPCPYLWTRYAHSCYFIPNSRKTWVASQEDCERRGATLAIVSNEEEQRFISSLKQRLWIGLSDLVTNNVWKWVNGEEADTMYWKPSQPDNCRDCGGEHCAELLPLPNHLKNWNDRNCDQRGSFICEKALHQICIQLL